MESLPDGEAHVWLANPDEVGEPGLHERCLALLGTEERERYQRLRPEGSRREFLAAHALARLTLSRYAPAPPEAWSFSTGEHGRPEIKGPSQMERLRFNLSHTRGMVACAVIREREIGVDVESRDRRVRHHELAERFLGEDESRTLRSLAPEEQPARFLELWTLKEAYLKAAGLGLSIPLRSFQFRISGVDPPRIHFDPALLSDDAAAWQFALHHPGRTHTLALAIRRPDRRPVAIRLFDVSREERTPFGPRSEGG